MLKFWRRRRVTVVTAAGMGMALAGALVTWSQLPVPVYASAGAIHVGAMTLHHPPDNGGLASPLELYTGGAAMVLVVSAGATVKATAVTIVGGQRVEGVCTMPGPTPTQLVEHCTFSIGGRRLTADDHLDFGASGAWHRRYSDGTEVTIGVPPDGGAVPVPFAIGE